VSRAFLEWLTEPVRVLKTMNYLIAYGLLLAGLILDGCGGFIFAVLGTHTVLWLRRA
jgi:hypothetical protein